MYEDRGHALRQPVCALEAGDRGGPVRMCVMVLRNWCVPRICLRNIVSAGVLRAGFVLHNMVVNMMSRARGVPLMK